MMNYNLHCDCSFCENERELTRRIKNIIRYASNGYDNLKSTHRPRGY